MPLKLVHIGNHIRLARYRSRLTIEAAADQIGTLSRNIILWELGGEPHIHSLPGVLRFLGYDPYPPTRITLRERLYSSRRALGLDCKQMGRLYGVDPKTWWWWETGKHSPLSSRIEELERFLEATYAEAAKAWPGNPPENSRAVPAIFRLKEGKPVAVKAIRRDARNRAKVGIAQPNLASGLPCQWINSKGASQAGRGHQSTPK